MQTTRVHSHPRYSIFVWGTFFRIGLGTIQSILVATILSSRDNAYYSSGFWTSALLWAVSFLISGAGATHITGTVRRAIATTFWSSVVAGFMTFVTSLLVIKQQLDLNPTVFFGRADEQSGLFLYLIGFFYLWHFVMFFGLTLGSAGAGLYRAMQKIATRFNCAGQ